MRAIQRIQGTRGTRAAATGPERLEPLLRELIGDALRAARHHQGRTLADVAARSGVSMQHVSDIERGIKDPSSEVVAAILGALDLEVTHLLRTLTLRSDTGGASGGERHAPATGRTLAPHGTSAPTLLAAA